MGSGPATAVDAGRSLPRWRLDRLAVTLAPAIAALLGVALWYLVAQFVERFPVPHEVVLAAGDILSTSQSYVDFGATIRRVLVGFVGGSLLGITLGAAMGSVPWCRAFFKPWVVLALSTPGPVAVIGAILVLGIGESSALIALVVSVTPYVVNIIVDAVGGLDPKLAEMSGVFRASTRERWRHVLIPQLVPALIAALQTAFALSWKLVVVIEALAVSRGIGAQMLRAFRVLDVDTGIAWASVFVLVMWLVDVVIFDKAEKRLLRWHRKAEWT